MYYRLRERFDEIHSSWGWFLALGIALIVLGVTALGAVWGATLASVLFLGWVMFFSGAFEVIASFGSRKWSGFLMNLFAGVLYIVVGGMIIGNPLASAAAVTMLLASLFLIGGVFRIITAVSLQYPNWGWAAVEGIVTLMLGVLIWAQWPSSALWVIGTFVGINLVFRGLAWMMFAFAARRLPPSSEVPTQREKREHAKRF